MKTYVINTSVAVKWYIPEPLSAAALYYLELYRQEEARLLAPDLIIAKMGNILWKKVRQNELTIQDARQVGDILSNYCPLRLISSSKLMPAALEIAISIGFTIYDGLYLALAVSVEAPLVTADQEIKKLAPDIKALQNITIKQRAQQEIKVN